MDRTATVREYFRLVDAADPAWMEKFTHDCEIWFPKFGSARGHAGLAQFGQVIGRIIAHLEHDLSELRIFEDAGAETVVAEGRESGRLTDGRTWPDPASSEGRFCNVFTFEGEQIKRLAIYVDPDFASDDAERLALLASGK